MIKNHPKGINKTTKYGPDKWFRIYPKLTSSRIIFAPNWDSSDVVLCVEYIYYATKVICQEFTKPSEALNKFFKLISQYAPNYNLKRLKHEMLKKQIKEL